MLKNQALALEKQTQRPEELWITPIGFKYRFGPVMKRLLQMQFLLLLFALMILPTSGQRANRPRGANLNNTSWQLYFKESAKDQWTRGEQITFLQGGRLEVSGKRCGKASWSLKGLKLFFDFDEACCCGGGEGEVTVKGSYATGGGQLGMRGTPFIFRLVKTK